MKNVWIGGKDAVIPEPGKAKPPPAQFSQWPPTELELELELVIEFHCLAQAIL
ncbi:hypothetical protein LQT97_21820 [Brucella pseudogrignonensis]|uniref:hypothetical protein n=1 Tax=Brucella pseudogrignonensis TaxID=419475 RepID=UPI001E3E53DE|nr:hypothetical protein [Brucella pseudogrignonensis]MCD4513873.1 hypothetical protein [Brucella pseudogrignonensis]